MKKQAPFRAFESWPADAQMALLSMAWAIGPAALPSFHHFNAACDAMNFRAAAGFCKMTSRQPGSVPRNKANATLLLNASVVLAGESTFPRSRLFYPTDLSGAN